MLARRAALEIIYQGVNISESIAKDLLSFEYTDNASAEADSISVTLKDDSGKWMSTWAPEQGDKIKASILTTNWRYDGDKGKLDCGTFMVDEPESGGPPTSININGAAIPSSNDFRDTNKSRTWEKVTTKKLASDIAAAAGLSLFYDTAKVYTINFIEQSEQTDSAFLADTLGKYGLSLKLFNDKVVVFSEAEYEAKGHIQTISRAVLENQANENINVSWTAKKSLTETGYDACEVTYTPPSSGKKLQYLFKLNDSPKKILRINKDVSSVAEAEIAAKAELRKANIKQFSMNFVLPGNVFLLASACVKVVGFGVYDGKYYIDKAGHSVGGGYTTSLETHKVLAGGY
jgi:phage protein D